MRMNMVIFRCRKACHHTHKKLDLGSLNVKHEIEDYSKLIISSCNF